MRHDVCECLFQSPIPCVLVLRQDLSLSGCLSRTTQAFISEGSESLACLSLVAIGLITVYCGAWKYQTPPQRTPLGSDIVLSVPRFPSVIRTT